MWFTVGWTITDVDETAIAAVPESDWGASLHQDGESTSQVPVRRAAKRDEAAIEI